MDFTPSKRRGDARAADGPLPAIGARHHRRFAPAALPIVSWLPHAGIVLHPQNRSNSQRKKTILDRNPSISLLPRWFILSVCRWRRDEARSMARCPAGRMVPAPQGLDPHRHRRLSPQRFVASSHQRTRRPICGVHLMDDGIICPVKGCEKFKPARNYLMCKACWHNVPKPMRDQWRSLYRAIWKPKSGRWMGRARLALGGHELNRRIAAFYEQEKRVITAAYLEPSS